ncbi:MAG: AMP-binding protein, partial [bacterium]|nr:AMP-binding protein [bacterium]
TMQRRYPVEASDAFLFKTSYQFDVSESELIGWFLGGGKLSILETGEEKNPQSIFDKIKTDKITHINFVPTMFNQFVNILNPHNLAKLSSLKYLFLSGEAIVSQSVTRFTRLVPDVALENLFSSAETSVYATTYSLSTWKGTGSIPIGRPISHTKTYILNFNDKKPVLLPVGIPGELCISGLGVARGYLKRNELEKIKFIDNPFESEESGIYSKLFRTGDLARWHPDGYIEHLGRIDRQIRIRGARIEIGEIESKLLEQEDIKEAIVVAREDQKGKYLCAYIVSDETVDTAEERDRLSHSLPPHMIPAYVMQIEEVPLTPDGKADRMELLKPEHDPHQVEGTLAEIEAEVLQLNIDDINLDDNFFDLGGHSLKASQVISKIHKALNVKVSMSEIFKRPTLRQLSEYLTEAMKEKYAAILPAEPKEYYLQSSAQKRLYFLHQLEDGDTVYNIQMMDIYCKGIEKEKLDEAFKKLIRRHESLRTSFHMIDGNALQKIHDFDEAGANFEIEYYETSEEGLIYTQAEDAGSQGNGASFEDVMAGFVKPFNLGEPPLLRAGFIKILGNTKILMLDMHHIIADGISLEILAKELWTLYDGKQLPQLRIQYKDYCEWLNGENQLKAVTEQENFWLNEFAGEIPMINLPTDYSRPLKLNFDGD